MSTVAVRASDRFMTPPRTAIVVLALLALTAALAVLLRPRTSEFLGIALFAVAAVYLGFALADGRGSRALVEVGALAIFLVVTLFGVWVARPVLALGWVAHGVWDLVHHPRIAIGADVPLWYVYACPAYDWVVAALVFVV